MGDTARPICRGCNKPDQVLTISALCATTESYLNGARIPFAPVDLEVPERWEFIMCRRCGKVIGLPKLVKTATGNAAVQKDSTGAEARTVRTSRPHGGTP